MNNNNLIEKYSRLQKIWFCLFLIALLIAGYIFIYYFFIGDVTGSKIEYLNNLQEDLLSAEVSSILEADLKTIAKDLCIKMKTLVDINDKFTGSLLSSFAFIASILFLFISQIYKNFRNVLQKTKNKCV